MLVIALALLVQSALFGRYAVFGVRPDLALLVLMILINSSGPVESIVYGFLIGFLQDVYSPEFLGVNALTMSLMAAMLDVLKERLTIEQYTVRAAVSVGVCLLHDLVYLSFYTKFDSALMTSIFLRESLLGAMYTSILFMLFMLLWEWMRGGGLLYVLEGIFRER